MIGCLPALAWSTWDGTGQLYSEYSGDLRCTACPLQAAASPADTQAQKRSWHVTSSQWRTLSRAKALPTSFQRWQWQTGRVHAWTPLVRLHKAAASLAPAVIPCHAHWSSAVRRLAQEQTAGFVSPAPAPRGPERHGR